MFACSAIILLISVIILALIVSFFIFGPHGGNHNQNPSQGYFPPIPSPMLSPQPHHSPAPRYPNIDYPQYTPTQNDCAAGQYFDPYSLECYECPEGFVNPQPSSLYCHQCPCSETPDSNHISCISCDGNPCITFCPDDL